MRRTKQENSEKTANPASALAEAALLVLMHVPSTSVKLKNTSCTKCYVIDVPQLRVIWCLEIQRNHCLS